MEIMCRVLHNTELTVNLICILNRLKKIVFFFNWITRPYMVIMFGFRKWEAEWVHDEHVNYIIAVSKTVAGNI